MNNVYEEWSSNPEWDYLRFTLLLMFLGKAPNILFSHPTLNPLTVFPEEG